jgi:MoxR-like ATPase/Trp operon repressor
MQDSTQDFTQRALAILENAWRQADDDEYESGLDQELVGAATGVLRDGSIAQAFALPTQLLRKAAAPTVDALSTQASDLTDGVSARVLAKRALVPWDQAQGAPLGGSRDPYVSNPLRRPSLSTLPDETHDERWQAIVDLLSAAERTEGAEQLLTMVLHEAREGAYTLGSLVREVLEIQAGEPGQVAVQDRRALVEQIGPTLIEASGAVQFECEGSSGRGSPSEVPWIRIFSPEQSPSAQAGWYVAYLFAADGHAAFLVLMQGVTAAGASTATSEAAAVAATVDASGAYQQDIDLRSAQGSQGRPSLYEQAVAVAIEYPRDALPPEEDLWSDLRKFAEFLADIYADDSELAPPSADFDALSVESIIEHAGVEGIEVSDQLVCSMVAALRTGKHLLFTGAPGTGKTTLAIALANAAAEVGLASGVDVVTATADWTAVDTVGGYWPTPDGSLSFSPGAVLRAIDAGRWLVVDEFNRADIDKAFGTLFTVLSGYGVTLPFLEGDGLYPVSITPPGGEADAETSTHSVPAQWRLIATLNNRDRDLLFGLSYALLRRFAIIDVPVPSPKEYEEILAQRAPTGDAELDARVRSLIGTPFRRLGPALLIDCGRYVGERWVLEGNTPDARSRVMGGALEAFVLAQFDDLSLPRQAEFASFLSSNILKEWSAEAASALIAGALGSDPQAVLSRMSAAGSSLEAVDGQGSE